MRQDKYLAYLLLIGFLLIILNTFLLFINIGSKILIVFISTIWSIIIITFEIISNYPITILIIYLIFRKLNNNKNSSNSISLTIYDCSIKIFSANE